jgi:hypothetical protein
MAESAGSKSTASEARYYTWVDAQGVMHNTLITPDKNSTEDSLTKSKSKSNFDAGEFPSEKEYQKSIAGRTEEKKPFFTWTDAEGVVRSEIKPEVLIEFVAEEVVYDAVFAPPFRLPSHVKEGQCCARYAKAFTATAEFNGSASYQVDDTLFSFLTQSGSVSAGYFVLPDLADKEIIVLKGYKLPSDSSFEVIALDSAYQPLYLSSKLRGIFVEQTWKDLAYKKIMLEISDAEIKYLVVFVRPGNSSLKQGDIKQQDALSNYRLSIMRDQLID